MFKLKFFSNKQYLLYLIVLFLITPLASSAEVMGSVMEDGINQTIACAKAKQSASDKMHGEFEQEIALDKIFNREKHAKFSVTGCQCSKNDSLSNYTCSADWGITYE